jgi:hypothetical protein
LESCTAGIKAVPVAYQTARVVFIDTPGFDDTKVSDTDILERICEWLITTSAFLSSKLTPLFFPADTIRS